MPSKKKTNTKSRIPILTKKKSKQILLSMKRRSSQIEHSMTSKQKKDLTHISLELANTHQQLISYKEKGQLPEFLRDVCKLDKNRLLQFCGILKVKTVSSDSYDSICKKIISGRPDFFKQPGTNSWKSWALGLATIPATFLGYFIKQNTKQNTVDSSSRQNLLKNRLIKADENAEKLFEKNLTALETGNKHDIPSYESLQEADQLVNKTEREFEEINSKIRESEEINSKIITPNYYCYIGYALAVSIALAGAAGVKYYRTKHLQIAAAIQYLRNNSDLERVSKQITRSYSRSHSSSQSRKKK
jgi:hypothetical protein